MRKSERGQNFDPVNSFPTWKLIYRWRKYPDWILNGMLRHTGLCFPGFSLSLQPFRKIIIWLMNSGFVYPDYKNLLYTKEAVVTFTRKTSNDFTSNSQLIQKTINNLFFSSGTVFCILILGAPSVCVHLPWSVRERLGLSFLCLLRNVVPQMFIWMMHVMELSIHQPPFRPPNVFKNYWTNWVYKHLPKKIVHPLYGWFSWDFS